MRVDGERRHLRMNDVPETLAMICYGPIAGFVLRTILSALLIVAGTKAGIGQSQDSAADPWAPVPTRKASLANESPLLFPYVNNGAVFGLPGTDVGDFWHRTQLTGDWGGARTDLARRGIFLDLYAFVQNTELSINVDTGRAGLWPGGLVHVTLESRFGSSPQSTFTVGSSVPHYYGLALPGPLLTHDVLPTEYYLFQSFGPRFSLVLGRILILTTFDQTIFGDSYRYYFANFNFNKTPQAPNLANPTALAAVGVWTPTHWLTLVGNVLDPNSQADNLADHAFDKVDIYGASVFSYKIGGLPGQSWAQGTWTNKSKIDLGSPFGPFSWATIGNFSQYLFVKGDSEATAQEFRSGHPLRGIGVFGRAGYAPKETNPITRDASIALFARGLHDRRKNDSFGGGFYYNEISRPLKDDIARLTGGKAAVNDEKGIEIFYDFAITPAIRLIPGYQHIWDPLTAQVARNHRGADVFNVRLSTTW